MKSLTQLVVVWMSVLLLQSSARSERKPTLYDEVAATIEKSESVETMLPLLPKELRENFTFIYQSRSPHGGLGDDVHNSVDPLHPRVLLFSKDGRLTLAFTTHPDKPGHNIVEAIHYEDETASFK